MSPDSTNLQTAWVLGTADGSCANCGGGANQWVTRVADLSAYAGKQPSYFNLLTDVWSQLGLWDVWYADIAIVGSDGTVQPLFHASPVTGSGGWYVSNPAGQTEGQACVEQGASCVTATAAQPAASATLATTYYISDHLGSAQMEFSSGGWPVWQGQFAPYGQEIQNGSLLQPDQADGSTNHYKFTGKERDSESGLDYFGARYYGSNMGRFMSPDWAAKAEPVPYSVLGDPQSLNLYSYVRNNPLSRNDPDGHCGQQASGGAPQDCSQVKVEAKVDQKPQTVQNQPMKGANGTDVKATGVEGKIVDTVTVKGEPAPGVKVTETNQNGDTKNGQPVSSTLNEGKGSTNADGQIGDKIGIYHPTDGTKATNDLIKGDFKNNTWSTTDTQTLTLSFPNGCTCSATSTRTMTNAGSSSKYTLTTTQPVVTPAPQ